MAANQWSKFSPIEPIAEEDKEGDINHDGVVDITDVAALINIVLGK